MSRQRDTSWSKVAGWYDQLVGESGSEYHREVVLPGTIRLLAAKPGEKVLDVACGQGVLCRMLFDRGVIATGVDASAPLIERARQMAAAESTAPPPPHAGADKPTFLRGDARDLGFLPERQFDAAACVLAIQNIHPIAPVFSGVARVLKAGGRFVLVLMHPCFRGHKETSWGWDDAKKVQYRRVDRYLLPRKAPIVAHPGRKDGAYTWSFHKPVEAYVKALRAAGMLIDTIEEWTSHKKSDSGPRARAENIARQEIPMFMAMRAVALHQK